MWFDLSYQTLRSYLNDDREPYLPRRATIYQRLDWLEKAVAEDPGLPVPILVKAGERARYVRDIRARYETG